MVEPALSIDEPTVLVLLAARNGACWLEEQLESIARQVGVRVTVVASDDRSTDDSREILHATESLGYLTLLPEWTGAGSSSGNFFRLIRECAATKAQFVAFSDQDDRWYPDKLIRACNALKLSGSSGYSSAVRAWWPDGRSRVLRQDPVVTEGDFFFEGAGQGCTFVITNQTFVRLASLVSEQPQVVARIHFHDWLTYAVCRTHGGSWIFDRVPSMDYRQHPGNVIGARRGLQAAGKRFGLIRSGWYAIQVDAIRDAVGSSGGQTSDALQQMNAARKPRVRWIAYLATSSRRRLSDRLTLVMAAIMGWL